MTLNLENLPASPVLRGRAPKLMTARRRRLWVAVVALVVAGLAASAMLWSYQPLVVGPAFGPVMVDTEVWASADGDVHLAEYRASGMDFGFAFSLQNHGRLPVTILELYPGHMGAERPDCFFNPGSAVGAAGRGQDVFHLDRLGPLPATVRPGEYAYLAVEGTIGPCQTDAITTFWTVPALVRVGWVQHVVELPINSRIGWGHDVEKSLSPRRVD